MSQFPGNECDRINIDGVQCNDEATTRVVFLRRALGAQWNDGVETLPVFLCDVCAHVFVAHPPVGAVAVSTTFPARRDGEDASDNDMYSTLGHGDAMPDATGEWRAQMRAEAEAFDRLRDARRAAMEMIVERDTFLDMWENGPDHCQHCGTVECFDAQENGDWPSLVICETVERDILRGHGT